MKIVNLLLLVLMGINSLIESAPTLNSNADLNAIKALESHNVLRRIHGVKELQLDNNLSKGAEAYARKLAESDGPCKIELKVSPHARLGGIDENIVIGCSDVMDYEMSSAEAIAKWYEEACHKKYNFSKTLKENGRHKFDHFRKIIWKKNRLLGIGTAKRYCASSGRATCTIMVARYRDVSDVSSAEENIVEGDYDAGKCDTYLENLLSARTNTPNTHGDLETDDAATRREWELIKAGVISTDEGYTGNPFETPV